MEGYPEAQFDFKAKKQSPVNSAVVCWRMQVQPFEEALMLFGRSKITAEVTIQWELEGAQTREMRAYMEGIVFWIHVQCIPPGTHIGIYPGSFSKAFQKASIEASNLKKLWIIFREEVVFIYNDTTWLQ